MGMTAVPAPQIKQSMSVLQLQLVEIDGLHFLKGNSVMRGQSPAIHGHHIAGAAFPFETVENMLASPDRHFFASRGIFQ